MSVPFSLPWMAGLQRPPSWEFPVQLSNLLDEETKPGTRYDLSGCWHSRAQSPEYQRPSQHGRCPTVSPGVSLPGRSWVCIHLSHSCLPVLKQHPLNISSQSISGRPLWSQCQGRASNYYLIVAYKVLLVEGGSEGWWLVRRDYRDLRTKILFPGDNSISAEERPRVSPADSLKQQRSSSQGKRS